MSRRVYKPVGRCIYCGSENGLTDEHIIAFGLNANLVLPEASCAKCNKITAQIEQRILRGFTRQMRTALGFQTRRKKERPATFKLGIVKGDRETIIDVPVGDHWVVLPMPLYHPPAYIDNQIFNKGREYREGIALVGVNVIWFSNPEEVRRRFNADRIFVVEKVDHIAFAQMLGKVAYCLAVAELGLDAIEEAYILPSILGKSSDLGQWVGSMADALGAAPGVEHTTQITTYRKERPAPSEQGSIIIAYIRVFSHAPSPFYTVVVGRTR